MEWEKGQEKGKVGEKGGGKRGGCEQWEETRHKKVMGRVCKRVAWVEVRRVGAEVNDLRSDLPPGL
jgi:hypothetical protein